MAPESYLENKIRKKVKVGGLEKEVVNIAGGVLEVKPLLGVEGYEIVIEPNGARTKKIRFEGPSEIRVMEYVMVGVILGDHKAGEPWNALYLKREGRSGFEPEPLGIDCQKGFIPTEQDQANLGLHRGPID